MTSWKTQDTGGDDHGGSHLVGPPSSGPHGAGRCVAPSEKLRIALIGCGGMGIYDLDDFMKAPEVSVVALCDVDRRHLNRTAEKVEKKYGKKPKTTVDFRAIIEHKDIDAVIIGTPDHWHAIPFILRLHGRQGRLLREADLAQHQGRPGHGQRGPALQTGEPDRHPAAVRRALPEGRQARAGRQARPDQHDPNLELQQRSARGLRQARRPATRLPRASITTAGWARRPSGRSTGARFHGTFRWFYDYAAGMIGDWNVHLQDIIHWAMDVTAPKSVHAAGGKFALDDIRDTPDTLLVTYEFDSPRGPFVQFYEMRKGNNHGIGGDPGHGMQFHGTDATLYLDRDRLPGHPRREADRGRSRAAAPTSTGRTCKIF